MVVELAVNFKISPVISQVATRYANPATGFLSLIKKLTKKKPYTYGDFSSPPDWLKDWTNLTKTDLLPKQLLFTNPDASGKILGRRMGPIDWDKIGGRPWEQQTNQWISEDIWKPIPSKTEEQMKQEIKKWLEQRGEQPWFKPTPWDMYPAPPTPGQPNPWMVDFYAALNDPEGYLAGKYAGGVMWDKVQQQSEKQREGRFSPVQLRSLADQLRQMGYPVPQDPALVVALARQKGLLKDETKLPSKPFNYPSEWNIFMPLADKPISAQEFSEWIWKGILEKIGLWDSSQKDSPQAFFVKKGDPNYNRIKSILDQYKIPYTVGEDGAIHTSQGNILRALQESGYGQGKLPPGVFPMSPTAYSTWTPMFPDLGINPETGLPYTAEEFAKLPDYQKVAIWWSKFLAPTGMISSAYQQSLAQSLAGQRATINQLQSTIGKYSGRFDEAWGVGQKAAGMLEQAAGKVYGLLGEAEGMLKQAAQMFVNAADETKPLYYEIYNDLKDVYNQARNLASTVSSSMNRMSETLWRQYGDIYNQIQRAYGSVISGQLQPGTQQWLNLLKAAQEAAVQETLGKYYTEKERRLLDELAGRGIISSKTAASALGDLQEAVAEQLRQAEYQILADYARQALELPFKQYEASLGLLQAPQTGATLLEAARRAQLAGLEPLSLAISAAAQRRGTVSDLASTLMAAARGYQTSGAQLAQMAPLYLRPGESLMQAARAMSSMAAEGLGAETSALSKQYAMWQGLPANLQSALKMYGDWSMGLLDVLSNLYLGEKKINASKKSNEFDPWHYIINLIGG